MQITTNFQRRVNYTGMHRAIARSYFILRRKLIIRTNNIRATINHSQEQNNYFPIALVI
jgi:hypothetical protein